MLRRLLPHCPVVLGLRGRAAPGANAAPLLAIDPVEPFATVVALPAQDVVAALKAQLAESERQRDEARIEVARLQVQLGDAHRAAAKAGAEPDPVAQDAADAMARQARRITELERELLDVKAQRDEARANFEHHLKERAQHTGAGALDLVPGLQEANQGLRARLRTQTDRANRAERRAAAAEQELAAFTAPAGACGRRRAERPGPGVVKVDGVEVVVPWGSRT